jgi:CTP:molybdopterin cytidylyltransferase MocA
LPAALCAQRQRVAAVVLAAGAASRFGAPKHELLLEEVLRRVRLSRQVDGIVVVSGAYEVQSQARVVPCAEWDRGPGASLRCGLDALEPDVGAAAVILGDGPDLAPEAVDRLVGAWREGAGSVLAASYGGVRGHPVVLDRAVWASVPDEGARALEPVLVPCDDLGDPGDVDRPQDLPERLR